MLTLQVPADGAADIGGNLNEASDTHSVEVDTVASTLEITGVPDSIQNDIFFITVTFREPVTGFTNTDIVLTREGTANALIVVTGEGTIYRARITPVGTGALDIQVPAGGAFDIGDNPNPDSAVHHVPIDVTRPTVEITEVPEEVQSGAFTVKIVFSEDVFGFDSEDLDVTPTDAATADATVTGQRDTYIAQITPAGAGSVEIQVPENVAEDVADNLNLASAVHTIGVDVTRPTVTLTDVPDLPQNGVFEVTIIFSEEVSGFIDTDIVLSGTDTAEATITLSGGGSTYSAELTPTGAGELTLQVPENIAADMGGNLNTASVAHTIRIDTVCPSVTITDVPQFVSAGAFAVTVTFSEAVTGFTDTDITLIGTGTAGGTATVAGEGSAYTVQITPSGTGTLTVQVPEAVALDIGGNPNTESEAHSMGVDAILPSVTITSVPTTIQNGPFSVAITFSDDVTGFIGTDVAVTGTDPGTAATVALSGSGTTYTAELTPTGEGSLTIQVPENVATDAAGNSNTASNTATVQVDTVRPSVTITDVPNTVQSGTFNVTVTFSEDVTGFTSTDMSVTGTGTASPTVTVSGSGSAYITELTLTGAGSLSIQVPEAVAFDVGGNPNTESSVPTVLVDATRPSVTLTDVPEPIQTGGFAVTITFSEPVTGFTSSDIVLTPTGTSEATVTLSGSGSVYTDQITPTGTGRFTLQVPENVASDAQGNLNTASAQHSVEVDTGQPSVTITDVPTTTQIGVFSVTITFSEEVTDFTWSAVALTLTDTAVATVRLSGSGSIYTAQITPTGTGSLSIQVPENVAGDRAGNLNTASTPHSIPVDATRPSVTITDVPDSIQTGDFSVTVIFSEEMIGFTAEDLTVTGADTVSATVTLSGSGRIYTATLTPTGAGAITLQVPENVATDAEGNPNTVSPPHSVEVDTEHPSVTVTDVPTGLQIGVFSVTIIFSEAVTGFTEADLAVTGADTASAAVTLSGSGRAYTAQIIPTGVGSFALQVPEHVATDAAGNLNTASVAHSVAVNINRPTVTITDVPTALQAGGFSVTITFSTEVTGFTGTDIALTPSGTASATVVVLGSGSTYTAQLTPTGIGALSIQVQENVAADANGNLNTASATHTVEIDTTRPVVDTTRPRVTITDVPTAPQAGPFSVTVTFSEDVTGFIGAEVRLTNTDTAAGTVILTGSGRIYTAQITPTGTGHLTIQVPENVAADANGNLNTVSQAHSIEIDTTRPSVTVTSVPTPPQTGVFSVTITFSTAVTGFTEADVAVPSGTSSATVTVAGRGSTYTATLTPTGAGALTIQVPENVAADAAGNLNTASVAHSVSVDTIRPSVSITTPAGIQEEPFDVTVVFSEPGTGFILSELEVAGVGVRLTNWAPQPGGTHYIAQITSDDATQVIVTFTVPENVTTDDAGNVNTAAEPQTVEVDTAVPPTVVGIETTVDETNPDSDPDINDLDGECDSVDGPLVGGTIGHITVSAYTPYNTSPVTDVVRFEIRRQKDTAWMRVEEMATESTVAEGTLNRYRKWLIELDTTGLNDTITKDDPAGGRDVRVDANPYLIRAVAIAGGEAHTGDDDLYASFSVDNIDDVAPLESTVIVAISDNIGTVTASDAGVFTCGGIVAEGVAPPVVTLIAKPRAHIKTFDHIRLVVNTRYANGTHGPVVDVGEVVFEEVECNRYTATVDVSPLPNAEYAFQALAVDAAMNLEKKVASAGTPVDVANYLPPPESVTTVDWLDNTEKDVAVLIEAYPNGYPITQQFTFTVVAAGIYPGELDVVFAGASARAAGTLTVEQTKDGGGGLADPRTFVVTLDLATTPDGTYPLTGLITKRNGASTFRLPQLKLDNTEPVVEVIVPQSGSELSPLPTIHAKFTDGAGSGVFSSNDTVILELVRLTPNGEAIEIPIDPNKVVIADTGTVGYTSPDVLIGDAYLLTVTVIDHLGNTTTVDVDFTIVGTLPGVSILSPRPGQALSHDAVVTNGAGLETPFRWTFTVVLDNTPPEISSVTPQGLVETADVTLSAVVVDEQSAITSVTIAVDGGDATPVAEADIQAGTISQAVTGLESGTHSATIVATSSGGSTSHVWTFTVMLDTTAPEISAVAPQGVVREANVMLSAVVVDEQSAITSVMIAVDGGAATPVAKADIQAGNTISV